MEKRTVRRMDTGTPMAEASLRNLEKQPRIKPGHTLNPNGRPKGARSLPAIMRRYCERPASEIRWVRKLASELGMRPSKCQVQDVIMAALVRNAALSGKAEFMRILLDRLEGPVTQRVEVEGKQLVMVIRKALPEDGDER